MKIFGDIFSREIVRFQFCSDLLSFKSQKMPSFVNNDEGPSIDEIRNNGGRAKSTLKKEGWIIGTFEAFLTEKNAGKVRFFFAEMFLLI